jgi:hypothetical protein
VQGDRFVHVNASTGGEALLGDGVAGQAMRYGEYRDVQAHRGRGGEGAVDRQSNQIWDYAGD